MTNILEAIVNIVHHKSYEIRSLYRGRNRANSMGDALECYVKDAFAGSLNIDDEAACMEIYSQKFSWLGAQNHPPDIMIAGGDAIEVKKTQSPNSNLALNSSYPKAKLYQVSPMVTNDCRTCEEWDVKDIIYCVGHVDDARLKSLWMVYGGIYAAEKSIYERIKTTISEGIKTIPDVVFSDSKELGRVNKVDPLGITGLRIRGMWQIENPRKVFGYLSDKQTSDFELVCIIPKDKYQSFGQTSIDKIENLNVDGFSIADVKVKNPNNPAKLIECKLVKFMV